MSERLTKRVGDGIRYRDGSYIVTCYPKNNNLTPVDELAVKLCDLEDKIESGTFVALPFNGADVVCVVRCMDCRHSALTSIDGELNCFKINKIVKCENYCSYGERMEQT